MLSESLPVSEEQRVLRLTRMPAVLAHRPSSEPAWEPRDQNASGKVAFSTCLELHDLENISRTASKQCFC